MANPWARYNLHSAPALNKYWSQWRSNIRCWHMNCLQLWCEPAKHVGWVLCSPRPTHPCPHHTCQCHHHHRHLRRMITIIIFLPSYLSKPAPIHSKKSASNRWSRSCWGWVALLPSSVNLFHPCWFVFVFVNIPQAATPRRSQGASRSRLGGKRRPARRQRWRGWYCRSPGSWSW